VKHGTYLSTKIPWTQDMQLHASCRLHKLAWLLPLFLCIAAAAPAAAPPAAPLAAQTSMPGKKDDTRIAKPAESPFHYTGVMYVSGNKPDPFLHPQHYKKTGQPAKIEDEEISRGIPPPGIAGTLIAQAKLEGISVNADRRIAIVRGAENRAYFLKEGDRLFDGYLKSVLEDSIILIRETKMRSGKITTQEITKRLRTP